MRPPIQNVVGSYHDFILRITKKEQLGVLSVSPFSSFFSTSCFQCTAAGLSAAGAMVTRNSVMAMVGKAGTC